MQFVCGHCTLETSYKLPGKYGNVCISIYRQCNSLPGSCLALGLVYHSFMIIIRRFLLVVHIIISIYTGYTAFYTSGKWIHFSGAFFPGCAGGGVWAAYPIVFSISNYWGIFHSITTVLLSVATTSTFILVAFRCAGAPPVIQWGSYRVVGKGRLEDYTFCHYCLKPKSPRTHHCRSCGMCILDMDHHCPFVSVRCFSVFWEEKSVWLGNVNRNLL